MSFLAVQKTIRHDCDEYETRAENFWNKEDAIAFIMREIKDCLMSTTASEHILSNTDAIEKIQNHISELKGLWCWEWKRRGNGDYFIISESSSINLKVPKNVKTPEDFCKCEECT